MDFFNCTKKGQVDKKDEPVLYWKLNPKLYGPLENKKIDLDLIC